MKNNTIKLVFILVILLLFVTCFYNEEKEYNNQRYLIHRYTLAEIQKASINISINPVGEQFWSVFGKFQNEYTLTDNENELLGKWMAFKKWGTMPIFYFFPNKLFIGDINIYDYVFKDKKENKLDKMIGEWFIINDKVNVVIYGYLNKIVNDQNTVFEYNICTPYNIELINTDAIDPFGYTRKAFYYLPLPRELRRKVEKQKMENSRELIRDQSARFLSVFPTSPVSRGYGFFNFFPSMSLRKLTGKEIAKSPELLMDIFENFKINIWSYQRLSIENPEKFPEL